MSNNSKKCPICANPTTREIFRAIVRHHYLAKYRFCDHCQFLFIEEPDWLDEAYKEPINICDTGLIARNLSLSRTVSVILYFLFGKQKQFLDYAGGYGIFTRLMRDVGFDFYWYDPYSTNLVARGFELDDNISNFEVLTCFEAFEHFVDPLKEAEKMFGFSHSILFSTCLLPAEIPKPGDWWYYGLDHGQHISFYSFATMEFIAKAFGCNLYSNGANIHIFTRRSLNPRFFKLLLKSSRYLFPYVRRHMNSKTEEDSKANVSSNTNVSYENPL